MTLRFVATVRHEEVELGLLLHAFGDDAQARGCERARLSPLTMAASLALQATSWIKDWSSFNALNGKFFR